MKIKTSAVVLTILSVIVVFGGLVYYNYGLPLLGFVADGNERENESTGGHAVGEGEILSTENEGSSGSSGPGEATSTDVSYAPEIPDSNINILLLGKDDSAGLTDTICVLSINQAEKKAMLISIPRDAYVPYSSSVKSALKKAGLYDSLGIFKINATANIGSSTVHYSGGNFSNRGVNFLCAIIKNMLGYRIDEYVEVDFEGFKDVVDAFGGINITVEENMYTAGGELVLSKGVHKLDGEMALYYARARHRYDSNGNEIGSSGDPYRKNHQLKMLTEMAQQVVTVENVLNAGNIIESLKGAIYHSFDLNDISAYASIGIDYANGKYEMETVLIEGEWFDPLGDGVSYCKIYNN